MYISRVHLKAVNSKLHQKSHKWSKVANKWILLRFTGAIREKCYLETSPLDLCLTLEKWVSTEHHLIHDQQRFTPVVNIHHSSSLSNLLASVMTKLVQKKLGESALPAINRTVGNKTSFWWSGFTVKNFVFCCSINVLYSISIPKVLWIVYDKNMHGSAVSFTFIISKHNLAVPDGENINVSEVKYRLFFTGHEQSRHIQIATSNVLISELCLFSSD